MILRRQVLDEGPRLILMVPAAGHADDRAVDVPRAVQLGMRVVGRHRRCPVVEIGMLVVDERDAPLSVEVHRELASLEGL
jgi:RecB family endonuclease NucS